MDPDTNPALSDFDAQNDSEGNEPSPDPVARDSRGIPVTATRQRSLKELLAEHGVDADEAALPYFRVKGKEQRIRVVQVHPTPPERPFRDGTIVTFARLEVEDVEGRRYLFDVTSKRLLGQLGAIEESAWFDISKTGSGMGTIYDVVQVRADDA